MSSNIKDKYQMIWVSFFSHQTLNDGFDGRTQTGDSLAEKQLTLLYVSLFNVMSLVLNELPCSFKTFKVLLAVNAVLCMLSWKLDLCVLKLA